MLAARAGPPASDSMILHPRPGIGVEVDRRVVMGLGTVPGGCVVWSDGENF
jgi:hypothetical protein